MGKCSALWTCAGKLKSADAIFEILGRQLRNPCPTRWNLLYDSFVINLCREKINVVMQRLNLPQLKEAELQFIK